MILCEKCGKMKGTPEEVKRVERAFLTSVKLHILKTMMP